MAIWRKGGFYPSAICDRWNAEMEEVRKMNSFWDPDSGESFFVHTACSRTF